MPAASHPSRSTILASPLLCSRDVRRTHSTTRPADRQLYRTRTATAHSLSFVPAVLLDGADDVPTLEERYTLYRSIIETLHCNALDVASVDAASDSSTPRFLLHEPIAIIASPGRDRLMMGHVATPLTHLQPQGTQSECRRHTTMLDHLTTLLLPSSAFFLQTDFAGLGGFTIDCGTREELLCIAQLTNDATLHLHNSNTAAFPAQSTPIASLRAVADNPSAFGQPNWPTTHWSAYACAALTYMLSPRFAHHQAIRGALSTAGVRCYISSSGALSLPHTGGVSSSAALTGALSMSLSHLLLPSSPLPLSALASVDYGEYYLGKFAGCADKMAQLYARRQALSVIGSKPEHFLSSLRFPTSALSLLVAESDMPRLTLPQASEWLRQQQLDDERVAEVVKHAQCVMVRFGSVVYVKAAEWLVDKVEADADKAGITPQQAAAVKAALLGQRKSGEKEVEGRGGPLLRELCSGGLFEEWLPELSGWEKRHERYALIYRLLTLLPHKLTHVHSGAEVDLHPRKAALYGISEVERGWAYVREVEQINQLPPGDEREASIERVLQYVQLSHDGDRAVVDYHSPPPTTPHPSHLSRHDARFALSAWATHPAVTLTNAALLSYATARPPLDVTQLPGSYERSTANVDRLVDELRGEWGGRAAGRVSAAGMGGRLSLHVRSECVDGVRRWMEERGWKCRQPQPGAPTQHIPLGKLDKELSAE